MELYIRESDKTLNIKDEDRLKLESLLDVCPYDGDQFDEENNPEGYRLGLADSEYILTLTKGKEVVKKVYVWEAGKHLKINEHWYFIDDSKEEILSILGSYK